MARSDGFGLAKQTALGTKNTTVEYWTPVESVDVGDNPELYSKEETVGHRFPTDEETGGRFWELTANGAARAASFPRILSTYFGPPTTTALTDAGAKKHLFDPVGKTLVPLSCFVHRADIAPKVSDLLFDCLGSSLGISVEPNDFLLYEAGMIARDNDDTVSVAPTITSDLTRRWTFDECKVFLSVDGGAETEEKVRAWSVSFENTIDTDMWVLGSKRLYSLPVGNASMEVGFEPVGSVTSLSAHYRRVLADPRNNVKVRMLAQGGPIVAVDKYEVEVIVYRSRYREGVLNISAPDTLKSMPVTLGASYDGTASKFVEVAVKNLVASY